HRFAAPACSEEFGLSRKSVADARETLLADRAGYDAGKVAAPAALGGALHRGPGHKCAVAVGLAGRRSEVLQADGDFVGLARKRFEPARWTDDGDVFRFLDVRAK